MAGRAAGRQADERGSLKRQASVAILRGIAAMLGDTDDAIRRYQHHPSF